MSKRDHEVYKNGPDVPGKGFTYDNGKYMCAYCDGVPWQYKKRNGRWVKKEELVGLEVKSALNDKTFKLL